MRIDVLTMVYIMLNEVASLRVHKDFFHAIFTLSTDLFTLLLILHRTCPFT